MNTATRLTSAFALLATVGLAASASAATVDTLTFSGIQSKALYGSGNAVTASYGAPTWMSGTVSKLHLSGTLRRVNTATRPNEAAILVRRLVPAGPNVQLMTHQFVIQPFAMGTSFRQVGNDWVVSIPDGFFAIPTKLISSTSGFDTAESLSMPGSFWDFQFIETFDDATASSAGADAVWDNLVINFDDQAPVDTAPAAVPGLSASTTRYGILSDDTLGSGSFTGGFINNLNVPAATPGARIRMARISGFITTAQYALTNVANFHPTSDARIRLVRSESVLQSPNAPAPLTQTNELLFTLPPGMTSTGYVNVTLPVADNNTFGNLGRTLPVSQDESGYTRSWYANLYEGTDSNNLDNVWNQLKIEFFTSQTPFGCNPSDVAGANQSQGPDNALTADDIIVFLGWYFASDMRTNVGGANQSTTPDALLTADDIIVFLGRYFAGC